MTTDDPPKFRVINGTGGDDTVPLKVGDRVGYYRRYRWSQQLIEHGIEAVKRVTKTRLTLASGKAFKTNGSEYGRSWEYACHLIDPDRLAEMVAKQHNDDAQLERVRKLRGFVETRLTGSEIDPFLSDAEKDQLRGIVEDICNGQLSKGGRRDARRAYPVGRSM